MRVKQFSCNVSIQINEKDVWSNLQNSVSVFVRIEGSSSADDILHVNCFQQQEGSDRQGKKIRLHVVPSQVSIFSL